jgi:RNA polymerase sigma factor (sigma-70 family)
MPLRGSHSCGCGISGTSTPVAVYSGWRPRREGTTTDDSELIERAKRGDVGAYGDLVRRYQHDARRTAAAIGGVDSADDAAQEAFVRAYASLHRFRTDAPFRPWLLAVVANVARNHHRAGRRWNRALHAEGERAGANGSAPAAEDVVVARHNQSAIRTAVDALPARYREVVACRYLLDLSEAETAVLLGIARGTVKSRLSRALDRLERTLQYEEHRA